MSNKLLCILLTSTGSRSIEAVIDCLRPIRHLLYLVGTNSIPEFVSLNDLDAAYIVPETSNEHFQDSLLKIIQAEQPEMIINGRDEEVPIISRLCSKTSTRFVGPLPSIADLFSDRYETFLFCRNHELPFVKTAYHREEVNDLIRSSGFPLIAKPRKFGHASKNVFILTKESQIDYFLNDGSYIFQPFVAPPETRTLFDKIDLGFGMPWVWNPPNDYYNIDFLLGPDGHEISRCITEAHRSGSIIKRMKLTDNSYLHSLASKHIKVLGENGHRGPLNIQGFIDENKIFQVFEWNARFVGSVYGFALLGKNMVADALTAFKDGFDSNFVWPTNESMLFRPMRYEAVPIEHIRELKANGYWTNNGFAGENTFVTPRYRNGCSR